MMRLTIAPKRLRSLRPALVAVMAAVLLAGCDVFSAQTAEDHLAAAREYQEAGETRAALIELRNAVQKDPDSGLARERLGLLALRAGDTGSAAKELSRALELGRPAAELTVPLAQALVQEGELERVLDLELPAEAPAAQRADLRAAEGFALRGLGRTEAACHAFGNVSEEFPEHLLAGLGMARCEAQDGDLQAAAERLAQLRQAHPEAARAWRLTGDVAAAQGSLDAALDAYTKALERQPRDPAALVARARIHLAREDFAAAREDAESARGMAEGSPLPHFLLGQVHFREEALADAASAFQEALNRDQEHRPSRLWLGITQFARDRHEQAVQHLGRYLESGPAAPRVRLLLAASEARLGQTERARDALSPLATAELEDTQMLAEIGRTALQLGDGALGARFLQRAVQQDPDDSAARVQLASVLMQSGETDRAIEELGAAAALDDQDDSADLLLIRTLMERGDYDQALQAIDRLAAKDPEAGRPLVLRGMVRLLQGDSAAARQQFETALEREGAVVAARHGLATLEARAGNMDAARAQFEAALEQEPENLATQLALGALAQRGGDAEGSLDWLRQAAESHPDNAQAQLVYARALAGNGQPEQALEQVTRAREPLPEQPQLLALKGALELRLERLDAAEASFTELAGLAPQSAQPHVALARVHAARDDADATRSALEAALERNADSGAALLALSRLEARTGNGERAVELARRLRELVPEALEPYTALAQAQLAAGSTEAALATLKEARSAFPDSGETALQLARLQAATGDGEAARQTLEARVEEAPDDALARRTLADLYLGQGDRDAAIAAYEAVLEQAPNDAATLNNLAALKTDSDPEAALDLAQRALERAPDSPHIQDTVGWLLLQHGGEGERERAMELLSGAREQLGDNAEVRLHYAVALARHGDPAEARAELETLIDEFPQTAEAGEARELLNTL